jgi:DNA-binding protein HU-beta
MKKNSSSPKPLRGPLKGDTSVTKQRLVASIAKISDLSRDESRQALNAVMLSITKILKAGKDVKIPGFCSFRVIHRPASDGRNPRTLEPLKIPAKKIPKFRPSLMLKEAIA